MADIELEKSQYNRSIATFLSGIKDELGNELVLFCSYTKDGVLGYFLGYEIKEEHEDYTTYTYKPLKFIKKDGEQSYLDALQAIKEYMDN